MVIEYPTKDSIKYFADDTIYIKADDATVNQYCIDLGYSDPTYEAEEQRFSNDGGLAYQYYGVLIGTTGSTSTWNTEFGFNKIVVKLTVTVD